MANDKAQLPPLESSRELKSVMQRYYAQLDEASTSKSRKIAWCSSQGPVELLRAMGFLVYFPENHGALLGATRTAGQFIGLANADGYSPDICSYLTSDIGAFLAGRNLLTESYHVSGLPRPDVLIFNNNQCRDVEEWFGFYARKFRIPLLGVRTPRGVGDVTPEVLAGVTGQMKHLAEDLAPIAGQKLDLQEFEKTVRLSKETSRLWGEVLNLSSHRPSPMSFFDACIHIGPAVVLRGTEEANSYYRLLLRELKNRITAGTGAVPREKFRVYWEGMPIWGRLRFLADTFARLDTCVAASTYGHSWVFPAFDPQDPFTSTAKAYTELFTVRDEPAKEEFLAAMLEKFEADGIVFHDSKTCANCSNNRYGLPQRLSRKTSVPHLILDGDLNDLRLFSQEQSVTNLEAFVEALAEMKAAAKGEEMVL